MTDIALPRLGPSLLAKCWCTSHRVCAWLETYIHTGGDGASWCQGGIEIIMHSAKYNIDFVIKILFFFLSLLLYLKAYGYVTEIIFNLAVNFSYFLSYSLDPVQFVCEA